jgi:hypothetical protein
MVSNITVSLNPQKGRSKKSVSHNKPQRISVNHSKRNLKESGYSREKLEPIQSISRHPLSSYTVIWFWLGVR